MKNSSRYLSKKKLDAMSLKEIDDLTSHLIRTSKIYDILSKEYLYILELEVYSFIRFKKSHITRIIKNEGGWINGFDVHGIKMNIIEPERYYRHKLCTQYKNCHPFQFIRGIKLPYEISLPEKKKRNVGIRNKKRTVQP